MLTRLRAGAFDCAYPDRARHGDPACSEGLAHPTRFERVTFAFGGQGWVYFPCLSTHFSPDRATRPSGRSPSGSSQSPSSAQCSPTEIVESDISIRANSEFSIWRLQV